MIYVKEEIYFRTAGTIISCIVLFIKGNKYGLLLRRLYNAHGTYNFLPFLWENIILGIRQL